ncbi:MAG TPA: TonB-dependent receptor, partial [Pyrinomonadaceae bacterium]|nr:TonB-dependent receptor [Pyrinomonadaceae bacterium]
TLNLTHVFNNATVNEARLGFNRFSFVGSAAVPLNPADFQIRNGIDQPIGLPQLNVAGGFNFGGPRQVPQGRGDTSFIVSDTLSRLSGSHSIKLGGEYRRFYSNFFMTDVGTFNFPSIGAFLQGTANSFSITLPSTASSIAQTAFDVFALDTFKWKPNLTFDLGLRYELNLPPTERYDRFIVFDPERAALLRVGTDIDEPYQKNALNFQPRVGLAWDPFKDGRTSVRLGYAIQTEQPLINVVLNTAANPPLATPLGVTGTVRLNNALSQAVAAGLTPTTVDHGYENTYVQSWNLNIQRDVGPSVVLMAGYFGSKGTNLRISRNINQPINGVRPFVRLSTSSPILPGASLGNITQVEGSGNSSYNALWSSANKRFARGLQLNASYTWSKSIDYNSLTSPPVVTVQNSYDVRGDRGLSDFDARHRFVLYGLYELPFKANQLVSGWQLAAILQVQSGNPVNIITSNASVNGVANTLRPDVTGPVQTIGSVDRWFDTAPFVAVSRFGNLGRNVIIGPGFNNVDFSLAKNTRLSERMTLQFRAEAFDVFNHPSFGQPGRVVGTLAFGRIVNTRFPTGDSGSSRQLQFALKLMF